MRENYEFVVDSGVDRYSVDSTEEETIVSQSASLVHNINHHPKFKLNRIRTQNIHLKPFDTAVILKSGH